MTVNLRHSALAENVRTNAVTTLLNGGTVELHGGARPAAVEAYAADTRLVALPFDARAFDDAVAGVALARVITAAKVDQSGEATCFLAKSAAGEPVFDGSVGDADVRQDATMIVDNVHLAARTTIGVSGFSYGPLAQE